jgi:hypothetical protein
VFVALFSQGHASAYDTFYSHRLTHGVSQQKYWVDSTASGQATDISWAVGKWNSTITPVYWIKTSTKSLSRMDWYRVSSINTWWAATTFYINTSTVDPEVTDWVWTKVRFDGDWADCPNQRGVTAHEIGHAFGLDHVFTGTTLMRDNIANQTTTTPGTDEVNGINYLY